MKVLAVVEIDDLTGEIKSELPEQIFSENCSAERAESFFKKVLELQRFKGNLHEIELNQKMRISANFEEIVQMGFVHRSEFEKIIEKKLLEIQQRITLKFYWDYYIMRPFKKAYWGIGLKIGPKMIKSLMKLRNG